MKQIKNSAKRWKPAIIFVSLMGLILTGIAVAAIHDEDILWIGRFSETKIDKGFPDDWQPITFESIPEHSQYQLIKDEGRVVVKATSNSASSGLGKKVRINLKDYPYIHWSWKAVNTLSNSKIGHKAGDDYPARVYIAFKYDPNRATFAEIFEQQVGKKVFGKDLPGSAIAYVWATSDPIGTIAPNPYTKRLRMFVVQSGQRYINNWVEEKRNIYEDYKKAFGKEPTEVSSIMIMTDTDNTKDSAVAYYGDIYLSKR